MLEDPVKDIEHQLVLAEEVLHNKRQGLRHANKHVTSAETAVDMLEETLRKTKSSMSVLNNLPGNEGNIMQDNIEDIEHELILAKEVFHNKKQGVNRANKHITRAEKAVNMLEDTSGGIKSSKSMLIATTM